MSSADATTERPLRILRVLTRPNLGGPTRQAIALWHAHRKLGCETLLVTGVVGPEEVMLSPADGGVPIVGTAVENGPGGWLTIYDMRRGVAPFADRRAGKQLREIIRSWRPDVVHTHTSKAGAIGRRAARRERVPVIAHTFHGHVLQDYFGKLPSLLLQKLERRLAARTDRLFAVSPSCADELAELGVAPRSRFEVVPPAVAGEQPLERAQARAQLGIGDDELRVCAIGRLVRIKRIEHFVQAVQLVDDLRGDVFGDGPDRAALAAAAGPRVQFRGAMPDVASLLPAFDAVVLPSIREGCPLVAIEAFQCGVPVVGYDVPGVRDALAHFGRGLLVPEADGPAGLARAIQSLADPSRRSELADAARAAVAVTRPEAVAAALSASYRKPTASSEGTGYD